MSESLYTSQVPAGGHLDGGAAIATSTRITFGVAGQVSAVRWWADQVDSDDTYIGELWSLSADTVGVKLASVSLGPITPGQVVTGWNVLPFSSPVNVSPGTVYGTVIINYGNVTNGKYVLTPHLFDTAIINGNLRGLANGEVVGGQTYSNGCFHVYGSTPPSPTVLPSDSFNNGSYFVDVVFNAAGATRIPDFMPFFN